MSAPAHLTHIGLRRAICNAKLIIISEMNKNIFQTMPLIDSEKESRNGNFSAPM